MKYFNKRVVVEGKKFQSIKEGKRYSELLLLQKGGLITSLETQVPYQIVLNGIKICKYFADFTYVDTKEGKSVVEDVKGFKTAMYRLKKKLVEASFGIKILET